MKLTKAQRGALEWFAARPDGASRFGGGDPTLLIVKRLRDAGLVESAGREPGTFGFTRYAITPAGREALTAAPTPLLTPGREVS